MTAALKQTVDNCSSDIIDYLSEKIWKNISVTDLYCIFWKYDFQGIAITDLIEFLIKQKIIIKTKDSYIVTKQLTKDKIKEILK